MNRARAAFVDVSAMDDSGLLIPAVAECLGVRDTGRRPIFEMLTERLREVRLVLLLDGVDRVLSDAAAAVANLLGACRDLKIVVTSRAPLHLRGEREFPVPPLDLPESSRQRSARDLLVVPAVALFVQRATDVSPDFALTDANAEAVAEICHRLDGLPLAIELAAMRIRLLTPEAILTRLEHRLPLLTGGARDLPARQQTLRDAIAWSYDLLTVEEQTLYRRLSVFVGGYTLEATEAVCDPDGSLGLDVLDGVTTLAAQSIVRQAEGPDGEPRFTMLETIREYGLVQLQTSGEEPVLRRRHLTYFTERSEQDEPHLLGSRMEGIVARQWAEHDNVRAVLA